MRVSILCDVFNQNFVRGVFDLRCEMHCVRAVRTLMGDGSDDVVRRTTIGFAV